MKKGVVKIAMFVMAVLFVAGLMLIPAGTVSADQDLTIRSGQSVKVDLKYDRVWWFEFTIDKGSVVEIKSTGSTDTKVWLYKSREDTTEIASNDDSGEGNNFYLIKYLDKGTYYFKAGTYGSGTTISNNDTEIFFNVISGGTFVADINKKNFPDDEFRKYVDEKLDMNDDNKLYDYEIRIANKIELKSDKVKSLKGIEFFTEIKSLTVPNCDLTSLDLSKNTKITELDCSYNPLLKNLVIKGCKDLKRLDVDATAITSIDLSPLYELTYLECSEMALEELDLTVCENIYSVVCKNSHLVSIKAKNCKKLYALHCSGNDLKALDLTGCDSFENLSCDSNSNLSLLKFPQKINILTCSDCDISSLDISDCTSLYQLDCRKNGIKKIDISSSPMLAAAYDESNLTSAGCYETTIRGKKVFLKIGSGITVTTMDAATDKLVDIDEKHFPDRNFRNIIKSYDLDGNGWLSNIEAARVQNLDIPQRNIDKLDGIQYFKYLTVLDCSGNNLEKLDLSKNVMLLNLNCNNNKITSLDLSRNTRLASVVSYSNQLTDLNISNCKKLTNIACFSNKLSSLTVSQCPRLTSLTCYSNRLSSLDLSKNTDLETLYCDENKLQTLDLRNNHSLKLVDCYVNSISSLKLGNSPYLRKLYCMGNKISEIDISGCPLLLKAYKEGVKENSYLGLIGEIYHVYDGKNENILGFDEGTKLVKEISLSINKKEANVICGKNLTLKATTNSTNTISWKSSDTKIATVDSTGKITGKQAGKVTITATVSGKSAKCTVTVLYKDVINSKDFWYAPTNYLTAKGVVKGYANQTEFRPANDCSRAQMITFLYRLQGEPKTKATTCKFTDVKKNDYFYKPVIWALEQGITTMSSDKKFNPQTICTRAQTVTFLWRMAGKPEPIAKTCRFHDVKKSDYFFKATIWASEKKIVAGLSDGTFNPQGKCLRRQMVTFLYKYDKYVNGKG
ncbi:MAG: S-layer homology domain-containing protein [Saccharofermentans sp.]|nr:S-layer homology domain-containing protein [Saccharofermentans sp.]